MIPNNLPSPTTPFIGRDDELAEILSLLMQPGCRMLSLTGPGGTGKTRLALQVAQQIVLTGNNNGIFFPDGVFFVPLQPLISASYLIPAIAEAVNLSFSGQETPARQLIHFLGDKQLLLVLDNFEHILEGANLLTTLLEAAPNVKLLITSREVLNLHEEWIRPVSGLQYPKTSDTHALEEYSAVQLFNQCALRVRGDFSLAQDSACVTLICQLVQGMPLALELAAAWLKTLSCQVIAAEIQRNLDFLTTNMRNVPERHRNIRAVFEQSWSLLTAEEQEIYQRLAVFQGTFGHQAAEDVMHADLHTLQTLVDKSLLRALPGGRYEIHSVLRQFALQKLAAGPESLVRHDHAAYYASFLQYQEQRLKGPDQSQALRDIDAEIDNIRAAWYWAAEHGQDEILHNAMGSLLLFYQMRTRLQEGLDAFRQALNFLEPGKGAIFDDLCTHAAWFATNLGNYQQAIEQYVLAISWLDQPPTVESTTMALCGISFIHYQASYPWDKAQIQTLYQENFDHYQNNGKQWAAAWSLFSLASMAEHEGKKEQAKSLASESVELFRLLGDGWGSTWALHLLGLIEIDLENYVAALSIFQESLRLCLASGDQGGVAFVLGQLGRIATLQKDYRNSWKYLIHAAQIGYQSNRPLDIFWHLIGLAHSFHAAGLDERAAELLAFVSVYPGFRWDREYIQRLLKEFESDLAPAVFTRARQRGEAQHLKGLIDSLEAEFASQPVAGIEPASVSEFEPGKIEELIEPLSERELETLRYLAAGLSNREIANKMSVTVGTVKKHLNNIFGKLQVSSRTQAIARAQALRLLARRV